MKKASLILLLAAVIPFWGTGCRSTPGTDKSLRKYSPVATEENCILVWQKNSFKLHPNRQYAVFNGTPIQLPEAPRYSQEMIYSVTPGILKNIIDPLLTGRYPQRQITRILIDPGHGGNDTGALGKVSKEKDLNLLLAQEIAFALKKAGFRVFMTRTKDIFLPLKTRVAMVKKYNADLFISVHHNSSRRNLQACGIECFAFLTPRPEDTVLAARIQSQLISATGSVNRGVKFANFAVLRKNPVPSVLIEAGFISNAGEEKRLVDAAFRRNAAQAVAAAVRSYAGKQ